MRLFTHYPNWMILGLALVALGVGLSNSGISHSQPPLNNESPSIRPYATPSATSIPAKAGIPSLTVTLAPKTVVKQGTPLQIRVQPGGQAAHQMLRVRIGSLSAPLYQASPDTLEAWVGIPVDMTPKATPITILGSDNQPVWQGTITISDGQYRRQNISVSKSTASLKPIPGELEAIQAMKNRQTPTRAWTPPFMSPTPDCKSSPFGVKRYHNGVYINDYHKGVDLRSPAGRPIKAINAGTVVMGTSAFRLHGGTVGLDHGWGISSIYIHMSKVAVKPGDHVSKGQIIGYVGSTGFATGPHLHWGLFANGTPINPDIWIPVGACR